VTQKIVQEHRGKVDVRSQPGEGSTFSLFLR
jgi:signal transduction histidine kinase